MTNQKTNRLGKALTAGVGIALVAGMTTASATIDHSPEQEAENTTSSKSNGSAAHDYAEALHIRKTAEKIEKTDLTPKIKRPVEKVAETDEAPTQEHIRESLTDNTPKPAEESISIESEDSDDRQEAPVENNSVTPKTEEPEQASEIAADNENGNERAVSVIEPEAKYISKVTIVTEDKETTIDVTDTEKTVEEVLEENVKTTPSTYRDENNKVVDKEVLTTTLENEANLTLYPTKRDVQKEEVSIPFQTEEKETDELYEGEREVEQEGVEGIGLKVTETVTNAHEASSQQSLKIIEAPQKEIVLVGTKPEPEPEPEPVVEPVTATPADTSITPPAPAPGRTQGSTVGTGDKVSNATATTDNAVVNLALKQVGKPYVWGGTSTSGFDCSGLVYWANAQNGKSVPRTARAQGAASKNVSWDNIQVGDIVYTNTHIGFYAGNDRVVHAANPSRGVVVDSAASFKQRGFKVGRL